MNPPQHKVDATLQAMERAHRATPDDQVRSFSQSINIARRDFERFATAEETANRTPQNTSGSLLALVETEQAVDQGFDYALEQVKESLAEMERKRMLALGAMTRLSPEESLTELRKVKEHILNLALRVPIRADFIVHGHNISLSIFRLFEAAERAEGEVDALINAKRSLDATTQEAPLKEHIETTQVVQPVQPSGSSDGVHYSDQAYTRPPIPQPEPLAEEPSYLATARGDYRAPQVYRSPEPASLPEQSWTTEEQPSHPMEVTHSSTSAPLQASETKAPSIAGLRMRQALQRSQNRTHRVQQSTDNAHHHAEYQIGDEEFDV